LSSTTGATVTATPSANATYTVTGTTGGCTKSDEVLITVKPLPNVVASADQDICNGSSATLNANGATTYSWSPATGLSSTTGATVTATPSANATYTVTGTTSGCTKSAEVDVNVYPVATVDANSDRSVCAGGTIILAGSVGGAATSGFWTASSGTFSNANSLTSSYTPSISSGTVTLTLSTNDPSGPCSAVTDQIVVTVNPSPATIAGDASFCAGGSTTLTASGADNYSWSPSTGLSATTGASVTANPSSNASYTVTGTSASGCTSTDLVVVTVNPIPSINPGSNQTLCQGPNANVTLAATGASTYSWTGGVTNGVPFTPSLGIQTYTVTGTSSNNCSATASLTITVNALPVVVSNDVSVCQSNTINVLVSGANSYTWSPTTYLSSASGSSVIYTPGLTTTYTVTGTTLLGCTSTDQVTVTVLSNAPINAGQDVSICLGASTTLTANGGSNYNWNNGLGSGNSFPVSPTISTTYSVVGTDAAGCQGTDNVTVSIISPPSVSAGSNQTVCAGTPITLNGGGATSYSWNPVVTNGVAFVPTANQTYIVTGTTSGCTATASVQVTVNPLPVTDAGPDKSVCTGASVTLSGSGTGAASYSWSGGISNGVAFIPPMTGTYTLTGTSLSGCTSSDQVLVTLNSLPIVNAGQDQPVCDGATVTLSGSGASNYSWSGGVTNGLSFIPSLGAIAYTVTGTSSAGCTGTDQVVVTVNPKPTPVIQGLSTYCTGSSAGLSTTSPYSSYLWSTGSVTPTINATIANNPISVTVTNSFGCSGVSSVYSVSENSVITANFTSTICQGESVLIHGISRNTAGVYSQTFSFGTGCDSIANVTLVVNPLPAVFAGADQTWCIGSTTSLNATGAVTYSWTNGITNGVTFTPTIGSTVYTVTGTSSQGCVATDQVVVFVNSLPIINAGADVSVCLGSPVILNGLGGSNYTWNNGVTNGLSFIPPLTSTYTVTGTDANGCTGTDQVFVNINSLPIVGAGQDAQICQGASVILSGSGAINYTWSNGVFNNVSFVASGSQTYTVTGTDANGCTNTDQVLVNVNSLPIINAGADVSVCLGSPVILNGLGGSNYTWNNGVTNGLSFIPPLTSTYTVTGTDANGCTNTDQVSVIVNPLPTVFAGLDDAICLGESVTLNGSGAPTYTWNNGVVNGVAFSPTSTLTYTLTGTSTSGCTNSDQVVVSVNPLPNVFAGNDLSVCDGVAITLTGSGAATYSWDNGVINGTSFNSSVGTIIYTVTGTSSTGCVNSDQVNVTVNTAPLVSFNADETIGCVPLLVNFTNTTPSSSNCIWTFSDGTVLVGCGSVSNSFDQVGCFDATLTVTDNNGCSNSFSAVDYICTQASPIAAFTPSQTEVSSFSTEVTFLNTSYGASNYYWSFAESSYSIEQNPVYVFPEDAGSYVVTLVASSSLGCTDVATATINVKEELVFFVPNTFTPDNDDYNDMFKPVFYSGFDPYDFSLLIFNRWGETVFESYNAESGWDGSYGANNEIKVVQEGTYTWVIRYRETENKGVRKVTGHVNVIR
jgi:gliding motility-associated-like protein